MQHHEIVTQLSLRCPSEAIYAISMETLLLAIVQRLGEKALTLSGEDLELAKEEVKAAIDHNLDERDYIEMGLDAWQIVLNL